MNTDIMNRLGWIVCASFEDRSVTGRAANWMLTRTLRWAHRELGHGDHTGQRSQGSVRLLLDAMNQPETFRAAAS